MPLPVTTDDVDDAEDAEELDAPKPRPSCVQRALNAMLACAFVLTGVAAVT